MEENNSLSNKYDAALAKYNTHLSDADIQACVADLIEKKVPENNTEEVKKFLTTSENQLRLANNKLDDVSVKKLTRKNPTMKAKFDALKGE